MPSSAEPALTTDRLTLHRFGIKDAEFAYALHQNPDLVRFIPMAAQATVADAQAWIDKIRSLDAPGRGWWRVDRHDGTPVAAVLLKPIPPSAGRSNDDVEIGWRQHAAYTGHGYVTEAARALLELGWADGLDRIVAVVDTDNLASQGVCLRLGMTHLGRTRDYYDEELELFEIRR